MECNRSGKTHAYWFQDVNFLPKPAQQLPDLHRRHRAIQSDRRPWSGAFVAANRPLRRWLDDQSDRARKIQRLPRTIASYVVRRGARPECLEDRSVLRHLGQYRTRSGVSRSKNFSRCLLSNGQGIGIWNACGPVEHCVESISGFIEAGVDHVTIRPIGSDLDEQLRIYLEEVLPALHS